MCAEKRGEEAREEGSRAEEGREEQKRSEEEAEDAVDFQSSDWHERVCHSMLNSYSFIPCTHI